MEKFKLVRTSYACPEQYDVFHGEERVGYMRLRHGCFTVEYPYCGGRLVLTGYPNGDGIFNDDEREMWVSKGMRAIRKHWRESNE